MVLVPVPVEPVPVLVAPQPERSLAGCADGTREGFRDVQRFPDIAGCAGAWSVPGVLLENPGEAPMCPGVRTHDTRAPRCGRRGGNSARDPYGQGCTVEDLCEQGWHVCEGAVEVSGRSVDGCAGAVEPQDPPVFFASRQSSNGCGVCALGTRTDADCDSAQCTDRCLPGSRLSNDVFGCGNFGAPTGTACGPLTRSSANFCEGLAGSSWHCNQPNAADDSGFCEAYTIVKDGPTHGGVLCCRDR